MVSRISNRNARWLWLHAQGLAAAPTGLVDVVGIVNRLGFVQLDTIQIVARAHHHILWSRNQNYREAMLDKCLSKDRMIFEHFTHDASILPITMYPMWKRQFDRLEQKARQWGWHRGMLNEKGHNVIRARILNEGPLCSRDFDSKVARKRGMWRRPPHKLALDYMWYAGQLSTSHRENFTKFYDVTERIIPASLRDEIHPDHVQIDWLCCSALDRLAFASESDIQKFWAATERAEVKTWIKQAAHPPIKVEVEAADGSWFQALAPHDIEHRMFKASMPSSRVRILNPFDPVIRDRKRLSRLFGFEYRVEIFVPAAKRQWGYYVYPLLEKDRFIGRIEVRADRKFGQLKIYKVWPEPGVKWTSTRTDKLAAELARMANFIGVKEIIWMDGEG